MKPQTCAAVAQIIPIFLVAVVADIRLRKTPFGETGAVLLGLLFVVLATSEWVFIAGVENEDGLPTWMATPFGLVLSVSTSSFLVYVAGEQYLAAWRLRLEREKAEARILTDAAAVETVSDALDAFDAKADLLISHLRQLTLRVPYRDDPETYLRMVRPHR